MVVWNAFLNGLLMALRILSQNWIWLIAIAFIIYLTVLNLIDVKNDFMDDERSVF